MMQVQAMQHNSMMKLFALAFNPNLKPEQCEMFAMPVPSARLETPLPPRQGAPVIAIARPVPSTQAPVRRVQGMTIPTLSQATQLVATHAIMPALVGAHSSEPCHFPTCGAPAVFGFQNASPMFCSVHKVDGMVNLSH